MADPAEINRFWIEEVGPEGWYKVDEALDSEIRSRFGAAWEAARDGDFGAWWHNRETRLAYLILTDQFPRNMFRGDGRSFATDTLARRLAHWAVSRGLDRAPGAARQFYYLPLMHSEVLEAQEQGVRMFLLKMPGTDNLRHARAHRQVILDFGRFPYRNAALGRRSSERELAYLEAGAYGWSLNHVDEGGWRGRAAD